MAIKKINYNGDSKVIKRLCEAVNALIDGGGGGSGGHTIQNPSGTDMTQRSKLRFKGVTSVTDDSVNDVTIVTALPFTITENLNGGYDVTYPS